jgi:hypothetical protein
MTMLLKTAISPEFRSRIIPSHLPPGMKMMQRTMTAADIEAVGGGDCGRHVGFGFAHGGF